MRSTETVVAHGFQAGSRASTVRPVDPAERRASRIGWWRSVTAKRHGRGTWEAGRPTDEVVTPSRRELPVPFC